MGWGFSKDIDDTLTESFDYFLPYVAEYFDVDEETLRKQNISYSNLPKEWKKDEIGFCRAYYELGRCYQNGIGIERNIDKAIECYRNSYLNESYEELCKLNVVY